MNETRYMIKISPVDKENSKWPCECGYFNEINDYGSNIIPVAKEKLFEHAYKTYEDAELGYKCSIGKYYSMPTLEYYKWWSEIKLLPKKERDRLILGQYEKVKGEYNVEIMTVDETWNDWVRVHNNKGGV